MNTYFNVSSSPHTRSSLSTSRVMIDVIISLIPASVVGVIRFGPHALLILIAAIVSAVATEYVFDVVAKRGMTINDFSAVVTGLLLGLCLSPTVPLYIPVLGSIFAILFVKCFFGGLGKNFMNPALAGRCFLLISFGSVMTTYVRPDAVSSATPLADLVNGRTVDLTKMFLGTSTGVIGSSAAALLIGGVYLIAIEAIAWEIPAAAFASFILFISLFGGHGFEPRFIAAHILGGSLIMSALYMASDPVTSPSTSLGQLIYGALVGILTGVFRLFATAEDSGSYAVIISNLVTPMIDEFVVPVPFGFRKSRKKEEERPFGIGMARPALNLLLITLAAGIGLAGVYNMTKKTIADQKDNSRLMSYQEVLPQAEKLESNEALSSIVESFGGSVYGSDFGRTYINEAVVGLDADGKTVGYVVNVTSADGFDGNITMSVGILEDGTVNAVAFNELNETAGMGMRAAEPEFKSQFEGRKVPAFILNKAGGSTAEDQIDSISGASVTSGAVVNAVNAALDFISGSVN